MDDKPPRPASYKLQDGCHNCQQCEVLHPQDDPIEYLCTLGAAPKPKRIAFNWHRRDKMWEWQLTLPNVHAAGICENYKTKS